MAIDMDRMWSEVHRKKNVVGRSGTLHKKIRNGKEVRALAFRVYVEEKAPVSSLSAEDLIPPVIDGVPTDVIAVGKMTALPIKKNTPDEDPSLYRRPTPAGVSAIYAGGSACTLGWLARDLTDSKTVIIANNHCTAKENKLPPGHPYVQPSPYDGDPIVLGHLKRYVEIKYIEFTCAFRNPLFQLYKKFFIKEDRNNLVDLGIVSVEEADIELELLNIGKLRGKRRGVIGEKMEKMGRTTGHTSEGILSDNDYIGTVQYGRGMALFGPVGLIQKDEFSAGGDSSSAIVTSSDKYFAGLLFAGSNTHTIFCHYDDIEREGNVEIIW